MAKARRRGLPTVTDNVHGAQLVRAFLGAGEMHVHEARPELAALLPEDSEAPVVLTYTDLANIVQAVRYNSRQM